MKIKEKLTNKETWLSYRKTLRYATHCCVRPFDGFWDLTHEKRGSLAAANTIIVLVLLTNLIKLGFTSFIFAPVNWDDVNLLMEIATFLVPFIVYCVANWCLTTLFDGKGTLRDIWMATAYAMTPYVIIQIPLIILSNFVTEEEGAFYTYFGYFSMIWCGLLIVASVMMIHDFLLGKAFLSLVFTAVGMLIIIFLLVLFFSLISDGVSYFYSIYKETVFRFY
ncbi:MAG: YIP1 family protein [Lachnospiraceae bacterium]|nr:YIP1 family protein [Lachnospiraceae bacterium]